MDAVASLIVATKNRSEELEVCLRSVVGQSVPLDILVNDDGSTDGTEAMVRSQFPSVRFLRSQESKGVCVARNTLVAEARCEIVISLDDDAAFSTPRVVEQTLLDFEGPRVGAVGIPYIDVRKGMAIKQLARDAQSVLGLPSFIGTAFAMRRDLFLDLGGFREYIFHQGEERDLCMRIYAAGYIVRAGRSDPIYHFESPKRDTWIMDVYGRRNDILFAWSYVPWRFLLPYFVVTTFNGLREALLRGRPGRRILGLLRGYADLRLADRRPVSTGTYLMYRRLRRNQLDMSELGAGLAKAGVDGEAEG